MKNTIKMSLAAAVAVSAFSTSAFAGNLEEMIKGVDVSGYVDYRLENKSIENKTGAANERSANWNEYSINVTATSKVNDIVSATVSAGFDEVTIGNSGLPNAAVSGSPALQNDTVAGVGVDQAYFTFAMGNTTVMAGKQNIPSVFVDQTDTVKQGTGIVALHKFSDAITVAGAHFLNNNLDGSAGTYSVMGITGVAADDTKTTELIAMGNIGMFNYAVNYNMTDLANVFGGTESDRYSIDLGLKVAGFTFDLRHTGTDTDRSDNGAITWDDAEVTKFTASTTVAGIKLGAMYAMTNEQNGVGGAVSSDVALDGDNDAKVHAKVWQLSTKGLNDGDLFAISADIPVMDKVTLGLNYAFANDGITITDRDQEEYLLRLTYKMSKNFTIHGRYSILDSETTTAGVKTETQTDYSRIQVKYTF